MRQRVKRFSVGTCAFLVLLAGVGKLGLVSDYALRQVVAQIQAAIGAPVRVAAVDLGYSSSTLSNLEVLENDRSVAPPPWSSARAVETDLSLWQLLRGDVTRGCVTFRDAAVTLRFDRDHHLLTRMPTPPPGELALPRMRIEEGSFTIQHDGVPDETFHNIHLELRSEGDKLSLSGTIDDPDWGQWTVSGGRANADEAFVLVLRTVKEKHVTPALLRRTPFVAPKTWNAVELEGDTTCEVTLHFEPNGHVRYHVALDPHDTTVYVPSIKLRADGARGHVVFEDDVLTLEDIRGLASGGDLKVGSTMDFRGAGTVMRFSIEANALNPRLLPLSWSVPAVEGKVNGRADLEVSIRDGVTTTRGRGEGSAKVLPFLPPIFLRLEADGRGFRFALGRG